MAFAIAIVDREKPPRLTHIYDIMERWMPKRLLDKARHIDKDTAKRIITAKMLENSVIGKAEDARSFFSSKILT